MRTCSFVKIGKSYLFLYLRKDDKMIQSYLEPITALSSNSASVPFTTNDIKTRSANCCGWLQHQKGSPLFTILEGGYYDVKFNANVSSDTAGVVALGLYQDGVLLPGTTVIATITTAGDYVNVSFDKTIQVCCRGNANLTVASVPSVLVGVVPGTATATQIPTIQNANFSITRNG